MNAVATQQGPLGWTIAQWQAAYRGGAQPEALLAGYAAEPGGAADKDNAWIRRVERIQLDEQLDRAGVVRAVRKAPIARSRASPSSWTRRRRKVWGCGTDTVPVSGSRGKPSARQAHAGASVIHSVIAVSERAPARTLAAAAATSAGSG